MIVVNQGKQGFVLLFNRKYIIESTSLVGISCMQGSLEFRGKELGIPSFVDGIQLF